jgi:hypothetical protein
MRRLRIESAEDGRLRAVDAKTGELIAGVWRIDIVRDDALRGGQRVTICLDPSKVDVAIDATADLQVLPMPRSASQFGRG